VPSLYFAYASNMDAALMARVAPGHRVLGVAELRERRLAFTRRSLRTGSGVADILAAPGESVWGVLYEIDDEQLAAIDQKEGNGWAYQRRVLDVQLREDGSQHAAHVYAVITPDAEHVDPSQEYFELILAAAGARGLPEQYVAALSARRRARW
jgi:gamma-glutamylcyclotransferase (GGCT)/AIG2-like uncharacterized protein YtfP